jgi:hypothetical protein
MSKVMMGSLNTPEKYYGLQNPHKMCLPSHQGVQFVLTTLSASLVSLEILANKGQKQCYYENL